MHRGYFKHWRKTEDSVIARAPYLYYRLWNHILCKANWKEKLLSTRNGYGVWVSAGCLITSLAGLCDGISTEERGVEKTPNKKTVKVALEWLQEQGMILLESNNFGTAIFVANWATYQSDVSVEVTDSIPLRGSPTGSPKQRQLDTTKEVLEVKEGKEVLLTTSSSVGKKPSDIGYRLAKLLLQIIRERIPDSKQPNLSVWARELDRAMRLDGRTEEELERVIVWLPSDPFWASNILSPGKLRDKYDQLKLKMVGPTAGCSAAQRDKYAHLEEPC